MEEGQSIISSKSPKPRAEEERNTKVLNYFESRAEENSSCKFTKNPKSQAEEERNHSKPRTEEEKNITSNLERKRIQVTRSSKTLNLVREKVRVSVRQKIPHAEEERNIKVSNLGRKRIRIAKFIKNF